MSEARQPRRRRPEQHEVLRMPPVWRRSLTESGMRRKTTRVDRLVIAIFVPVCALVVVWMLGYLVTHAAG